MSSRRNKPAPIDHRRAPGGNMRLKAFLSFHREALGLVIGVAIILAIGALALVLKQTAQVTYGTITDFGFGAGKSPGERNVHVWVDDREAVVPLPLGQVCKTGDRVELVRWRMILGYSYGFGPRGCWNPK